MIRDLFINQFNAHTQAEILRRSESTLRRLFLLSFAPALRFSLGQTKNLLNFRAILDNNVSCLFNLNNLDPQTQRLLGCLLTVGFENAALSRSNISENERLPLHLFIDEFGQFCSQSEDALERILTLTRKFGLSLHLSTQTIASLKHLYPALQNALHISFRMGDVDAPFWHQSLQILILHLSSVLAQIAFFHLT